MEGSLHDKRHFRFLIAYVVGQEANCYANDEDGPEDVKTLQNHQEAVEKVVAEEGFVDSHRVNPRTVNNPSAERVKIKDFFKRLLTSRCLFLQNKSICDCVCTGKER